MDASDLPSPLPDFKRYILQAEEELRLEVGFRKQSSCKIHLHKGSCELQGIELAQGKTYVLSDGGGLKLALFTWYGCVLDVACDENNLEIGYTSDETACNIAYVNTHAQLEALRDDAVSGQEAQGPRVLIVGPVESGKSSLAKLLVAYATKLGRTPMWVDLDPADNAISIPGTLAACPVMNQDALTVEAYATTGLPPGTSAPLVLWHGSTTLQPELFKAQVSALGRKIEQRLASDDWARSSGLIVNTNGWIQDEGYNLLLHAVSALKISVILVMGHDRLYSMLKNSVGGAGDNTTKDNHTASAGSNPKSAAAIKVIKVPRSGGVVSRESTFLRNCRSRSVKRYFYGDLVDAPHLPSSSSSAAAVVNPQQAPPHRVPQLTPFLLQLPFNQVHIYKFTAMSLSASLLPVAAAQATEPIQLSPVEISESLQHAVLAVCHPVAVATFQQSGKARDLYESGVAGFCAIERVVMDTERVHLLTPCAGSLPSQTLLLGDITWMD